MPDLMSECIGAETLNPSHCEVCQRWTRSSNIRDTESSPVVLKSMEKIGHVSTNVSSVSRIKGLKLLNDKDFFTDTACSRITGVYKLIWVSSAAVPFKMNQKYFRTCVTLKDDVCDVEHSLNST